MSLFRVFYKLNAISDYLSSILLEPKAAFIEETGSLSVAQID